MLFMVARRARIVSCALCASISLSLLGFVFSSGAFCINCDFYKFSQRIFSLSWSDRHQRRRDRTFPISIVNQSPPRALFEINRAFICQSKIGSQRTESTVNMCGNWNRIVERFDFIKYFDIFDFIKIIHSPNREMRRTHFQFAICSRVCVCVCAISARRWNSVSWIAVNAQSHNYSDFHFDIQMSVTQCKYAFDPRTRACLAALSMTMHGRLVNGNYSRICHSMIIRRSINVCSNAFRMHSTSIVRMGIGYRATENGRSTEIISNIYWL